MTTYSIGLAILVLAGSAKDTPLDVAQELAKTTYKGYVYGSKGDCKVDCVTYLVAVLEEAAKRHGKTLSNKVKSEILISHLSKEELGKLQDLVKDGDKKIRGVQSALVNAKLGKTIDPKDAKAGVLV